MPLNPLHVFDDRDTETKQYKVLVIDKPEKWDDADSFHFNCEIPFPGQHKKLLVPITGISYNDYESIENRYRIPERPDAGSPEMSMEKYEKDKAFILVNRKVEIFELCTGNKIPGNSQDEKLKWLNSLTSGDADMLFEKLVNEYFNLESGSLTREYEQDQKVEVVEFKSFEDWSNLSNTGSFFRMHRQQEDYICEFPLNKLSEERKKEIEDACKEPFPPSKPGKNPVTGRIDPAFPDYNYKDSRYLAALKVNNQKRTVMIFDELLQFKIPGGSTEEKYRWIGKKLVGDVVQLRSYIEGNVMDYRARLNFI